MGSLCPDSLYQAFPTCTALGLVLLSKDHEDILYRPAILQMLSGKVLPCVGGTWLL